MKDERLITFVYEFSESILFRLLSFIFERSGPLSNQESEVIHVLQSNACAACHGEQGLVCHVERNGDFAVGDADNTLRFEDPL